MKEQILALEQLAMPLEATPEQRHHLNEAITNFVDEFIDDLPTSKSYHVASHEGKAISETPIGRYTLQMDEILDLYRHNVCETGINAASGRHLGYIPGGGLYYSALADYLAAATNPYSGLYYANPGAVRVENQIIKWLCQLVGYTEENAFGNLTSGGSIANLIAICAARDNKNIRARDVETAVVYYSRQVHHCVIKALRIGGLWEVQTREIPMDDSLKMRIDLLQQQIETDLTNGLKPFLVVASAGTTDVGIIDPLEEIADLSAKYDLWFHVDAAYGGAFLLSELKNEDGTITKDQFKGIERSDSVTIDPHKGFFLPYGLGAVVVRDIHTLYKTNSFKANYLQDTYNVSEPSPSDLSPELSKHFRGLRLWLPLLLLGEAPFRAALEEKILLTRYFYNEVQKLGFVVGPYPELSICTYRYLPEEGDANEFNNLIAQKLREDGRFFISTTNIAGVNWLRLAVLSFRTHLVEIDNFLVFLKQLMHNLSPVSIQKAN